MMCKLLLLLRMKGVGRTFKVAGQHVLAEGGHVSNTEGRACAGPHNNSR